MYIYKMFGFNNHNNIKYIIFIVFCILKVTTKYIGNEEYETEIKYLNPFINNSNYTEISNNNTVINNPYSYDIFYVLDSSCILAIISIIIFLIGMKFLISTIKKQIKEEIRSDYVLL